MDSCCVCWGMRIALRISKSLLAKGHQNILITSNTPSSKYIWEESELNNVDHHYLPLDFYFTTKRFVQSIAANNLIIIEMKKFGLTYTGYVKNIIRI